MRDDDAYARQDADARRRKRAAVAQYDMRSPKRYAMTRDAAAAPIAQQRKMRAPQRCRRRERLIRCARAPSARHDADIMLCLTPKMMRFAQRERKDSR